MRAFSSVALRSAVGLAFAQLGSWNRCRDISYSGSTTCESGWSCFYLNERFSHSEPRWIKSSNKAINTQISTQHKKNRIQIR
ncbi:Mannan endo-1,4-beta-mannosidase F [Penicillium digitatum PHI26]|uniref:Mannan endo-1,4-beta-mannosidase F n=2 Tax=Penicillium digitatum TaxID=36651 RepID=K9GQI2_PEND2|nr:Mannan endo-1,4-beta-mannosidase F [Penicillium digitatum Pd1]EKV10258.1 Mannan endo-1,4-beta-mannosidase F [Penicillium digitatum Pd1]EKV15356.1 Mannan endo-1,4-beta-mannosidase F [Penicillium digitatum PHI26]